MKRVWLLVPAAALCALPALAAGGGPDAKALYASKCAGCHGAKLSGGYAPALNAEGSKRSLAWITAQIENPKVHKATSGMPSAATLKLNNAQVKALAAYLFAQKKK